MVRRVRAWVQCTYNNMTAVWPLPYSVPSPPQLLILKLPNVNSKLISPLQYPGSRDLLYTTSECHFPQVVLSLGRDDVCFPHRPPGGLQADGQTLEPNPGGNHTAVSCSYVMPIIYGVKESSACRAFQSAQPTI
jgi:hypothetical protein